MFGNPGGGEGGGDHPVQKLTNESISIQSETLLEWLCNYLRGVNLNIQTSYSDWLSKYKCHELTNQKCCQRGSSPQEGNGLSCNFHVQKYLCVEKNKALNTVLQTDRGQYECQVKSRNHNNKMQIITQLRKLQIWCCFNLALFNHLCREPLQVEDWVGGDDDDASLMNNYNSQDVDEMMCLVDLTEQYKDMPRSGFNFFFSYSLYM